MAKSISRKRVEKSLLEQLKKKNADVDCFIDRINDYMNLWDLKNELINDIKERGVVYDDVSSVGVPIKKNNPSTKELIGVSREMNSILDKLDLNTKNCQSDEDDEL